MSKSKAQRELERLKDEAIKIITNGGQLPPYISDPLMAMPEVAEELKAAKAEQTRKKRQQRDANTQFVLNTGSGGYNALYYLLGDVDGPALIDKVKEIAQSGDTLQIQEMLATQALTLQTMFNRWVVLASKTKSDEALQAMAHLALKSQEQCRRTLQTLADVKSPKKPSQFIKNYVAQQLNQLQMEQQSKEKISETFSENLSNELLSEAENGTPVDIGRETVASAINPDLETVGDLNRSYNN